MSDDAILLLILILIFLSIFSEDDPKGPGNEDGVDR